MDFGWLVMMCQCRVILHNKCTIPVSDVDNGGAYKWVRAGGTWEISVPPYQFCCKPKTTLKKIKNWSKKASVPSGGCRSAVEMAGTGQPHRDWSNCHRLDFKFSQGGKFLSRLSIFSLGDKAGELGWPCNSGPIDLSLQVLHTFIHSFNTHDGLSTN